MNKAMRHWPVVLMVLSLTACGSQAAGSAGAGAGAGVSTEPVAVDGAQAFATCANCHAHQAGAAHRSGPNLHGVVGRRAGAAAGFGYSPALRASGIVWDAQTLDAYLRAPTQRVPGTRMTTVTADAGKRQALIDYLSTP